MKRVFKATAVLTSIAILLIVVARFVFPLPDISELAAGGAEVRVLTNAMNTTDV